VDRGNKVTVQTYSSVLDAIGRQLDLLEGETANLRGMTVAMFASFPASPTVREQVLVDFGTSHSSDRFSVALSDGAFAFTLRDSHGAAHTLSVQRPLVVPFANGLELTLLEVEFGVNAFGFYFAGFLNRQCVVRYSAGAIPLDLEALNHSVLGSDFKGSTDADFQIIEMFIYKRTLSWRERLVVYHHLDELYSYYLSPLAIYPPNSLTIRGHKFMSSPGHPTCPGASPDVARPVTLDDRGPVGWWLASAGVKLSDGSSPPRDVRLGVQTIPLPGMDRVPDQAQA
jgi:hypothetical protein